MALTVSPARRLRGLAVVACTALALPVLAAAPAGAQTTTTSTSSSSATSAAALRVVLNLPQGNTVQIDVDPVSGTVRSVAGSSPEAEAYAAILAGTVAGNGEALGAARASLAANEPREVQGSPLAAVNEGIAGSPLAEFLSVSLADARAAVTEAPSSTSQAGTALSLGLPAALADGLAAPLAELIAGLESVIVALEPGDELLNGVCAGLPAATDPLTEVVEQVPVLGPVVVDVEQGLLDEDTGTLCQLRTFLLAVLDELEASLAELGRLGLLNVGTLQASQSIVTEGAKVTSTATAQIADVSVLGVANPFGDLAALSTRSTSVVAPGTAEATVDAAAVEVDVDPIALVLTDLDETLEGQLLGIELDSVQDLLVQLQALLDALAGIGVEGGLLGDPAGTTLDSCPDAVAPTLSGTFEEPGVCAAAAVRGYGLAVTLPAQLAEPLGITGPLLQLTFAPSGAVARSATTTTTTTSNARPLPRTGPETALAGVGIALLLGAALVRRRRAAAEL